MVPWSRAPSCEESMISTSGISSIFMKSKLFLRVPPNSILFLFLPVLEVNPTSFGKCERSSESATARALKSMLKTQVALTMEAQLCLKRVRHSSIRTTTSSRVTSSTCQSRSRCSNQLGRSHPRPFCLCKVVQESQILGQLVTIQWPSLESKTSRFKKDRIKVGTYNQRWNQLRKWSQEIWRAISASYQSVIKTSRIWKYNRHTTRRIRTGHHKKEAKQWCPHRKKLRMQALTVTQSNHRTRVDRIRRKVSGTPILRTQTCHSMKRLFKSIIRKCWRM